MPGVLDDEHRARQPVEPFRWRRSGDCMSIRLMESDAMVGPARRFRDIKAVNVALDPISRKQVSKPKGAAAFPGANLDNRIRPVFPNQALIQREIKRTLETIDPFVLVRHDAALQVEKDAQRDG